MIIFSTCFIDINRGDSHNFGPLSRGAEKYIENFNNMIDDGFDYPLIVYTHDWIIAQMVSTRRYKSNIFFVDILTVDTFLKEPFLAMESLIINSENFKKKIPDFRKSAIEHNHPKYTLLTHSKVKILEHTRKIFSNFIFYGWIDFGYPKVKNPLGWPVCERPSTPKNIDFSLLEKKIHCGTIKLLDRHVDEEEFLQCNYFTIYAFSFIIHTEVFDKFIRLYTEKLIAWQNSHHSDDEQNLIYQLYQDNKEMFKMFKIDSAWGFFPENLNFGAIPKVLG